MALINTKCKICKKPMRVQAWDIENSGRKHCSRACYAVARRGQPSNNTGKHWNLSEETKAKMRMYQTTPEHKANLSASCKGRTSAMKGKNQSSESKRKMSISHILRGTKPPVMVGAKNPHWKGGISSPDKLERAKFRQQLQSKILQRDNYTCQICDEYGGKLQIDHIESWADNPELRFEKTNCRTLCMACHYYITFKRKLPRGVIWGHNLSRRTIKS